MSFYYKGCLIHVVATVSGSLFIDRKIMMSIDDFLGNSGVQEDQMFQLVIFFH